MRSKDGAENCSKCNGDGCSSCNRTGEVVTCPGCGVQDNADKVEHTFTCRVCRTSFDRNGEVLAQEQGKVKDPDRAALLERRKTGRWPR